MWYTTNGENMNDNIKDLLISTSFEDVELGLELCRRLDVPIIELSRVYRDLLTAKPYSGLSSLFYQYLERDLYVSINDESEQYFKSWKH
jgi:hypothetical protein